MHNNTNMHACRRVRYDERHAGRAREEETTGYSKRHTFESEMAGDGEAASVVDVGVRAQLLKPCEHKEAAFHVHKRVGRVQHIPQIQAVRAWPRITKTMEPLANAQLQFVSPNVFKISRPAQTL